MDVGVIGAARLRTVTARSHVEVWAYDATSGQDVLAQVTDGPTSANAVVRQAYANAVRVLDYYRSEFGRDGHDGRGTTLKLRVHAPDAETGRGQANNAYWFNDEGRIWLGDGDGSLFAPLGNAVDVVGHEFTHGVIDSEVTLRTWGQEGALHESFADVLATGLDGNWQIGETVFTPGVPGDAIRDLQHPKWDNATKLPVGASEPHELADVPNHAAFRVAQTVGASTMRRIWYTALTEHLQNGSGYAGARQATLGAAEMLYGTKSREYTAVRDAWEAVGVDATTAKEFFYSQSTGFRFDVRSVERIRARTSLRAS